MVHAPGFERFEAIEPSGRRRTVEFQKAGMLSVGDRPELFFFLVDGREAVVGISGEALRSVQRARRYLTREEKMDITGSWLRAVIEEGRPLDSENLFLRQADLERKIAALGLWETR